MLYTKVPDNVRLIYIDLLLLLTKRFKGTDDNVVLLYIERDLLLTPSLPS